MRSLIPTLETVWLATMLIAFVKVADPIPCTATEPVPKSVKMPGKGEVMSAVSPLKDNDTELFEKGALPRLPSPVVCKVYVIGAADAPDENKHKIARRRRFIVGFASYQHSIHTVNEPRSAWLNL